MKYIYIIILSIVCGITSSCVQNKETKKFHFSDSYVEKNRGAYSFEIPEVQELMHIIIALTPTGIKDKNMVEHDSEYYKSVMTFFEKYMAEHIIQKVDELLKQGKYTVLKMDACGYVFDNEKIIKDGVYEKLSWGGPNFVEPLIPDLEKFAVKTDFREFYNNNLSFYNTQIKKLENQTPVKKQWNWLERNFDIRYDNYRITFSPLTNGSHSTNKFIQDNFKQIVMFICGPTDNNEFSDEVIEGLMTRATFTEINHNYVNPISDKYREEINSAFSNLQIWADENAIKNYNSRYAVFNEYLTWALFSLYSKDNYSEESFKILNNVIEDRMVSRGFVQFGIFNQMLLNLYTTRDENVEGLYPYILLWCKQVK